MPARYVAGVDEDRRHDAFAEGMSNAAEAVKSGRVSILAYATRVDANDVRRLGGIGPDPHGVGLTRSESPPDR